MTQLNHELQMETVKYHQIAVELKNETDQCQLESEKLTEEKEKWTEEKLEATKASVKNLMR